MVAPPGKRISANVDSLHRFFIPLFLFSTETQRPPNKRRKRKGSQTGGGAGINQAQPAAPNKKRSPGPNFSLASQVNSFYLKLIVTLKEITL
jgi:LIM domain-binding protein 1